MQTLETTEINPNEIIMRIVFRSFHLFILIYVICLVQLIPNFKARSIASYLYLIQVFRKPVWKQSLFFAVLFAATGGSKVTHFRFNAAALGSRIAWRADVRVCFYCFASCDGVYIFAFCDLMSRMASLYYLSSVFRY